MALTPEIPTSFVPRQQSTIPAGPSTSRLDFRGALRLTCYVLFVLSLIGAGGIFAYGELLSSEQTTQDAALAKAESSIDPATVTSFLRLEARLSSSKTLLADHVALSNFFAVLENLTPSTASFASLDATLASDNSVAVEMTGTAASFNALAALSAAFATNADIKDAIFSNIAVSKSGAVSFALSATLDPTLVSYAGTPSP